MAEGLGGCLRRTGEFILGGSGGAKSFFSGPKRPPSLFKEVKGKAMRKSSARRQGVSRGLRPDLLILNKGPYNLPILI